MQISRISSQNTTRNCFSNGEVKRADVSFTGLSDTFKNTAKKMKNTGFLNKAKNYIVKKFKQLIKWVKNLFKTSATAKTAQPQSDNVITFYDLQKSKSRVKPNRQYATGASKSVLFEEAKAKSFKQPKFKNETENLSKKLKENDLGKLIDDMTKEALGKL